MRVWNRGLSADIKLHIKRDKENTLNMEKGIHPFYFKVKYLVTE